MKRCRILLLLLCLLPLAAPAEETVDTPDGEWLEYWEETGWTEYCSIKNDTLILREGVTALGSAERDRWDDEAETFIEVEPRFDDEDTMCFDHAYGDGDFSRVSLPSTLKYLGGCSFCCYHFSEFTLPAWLEGIEPYAFLYCDIDVLRIEAALPWDPGGGGKLYLRRHERRGAPDRQL